MSRLHAPSMVLILCRRFASFQPQTIVVNNHGFKRDIIYTGPINGFMYKLKRSSLLGTAFSIISAPIALYYLGSESWSWTSNLFFISGGNCLGYNGILDVVVISTSAMQFWAANRIIGEYVTRVYKVDQPVPDLQVSVNDFLVEFETINWNGRTRSRALFVRDLKFASPSQIIVKSQKEKFHLCPRLVSESQLLSRIGTL